MPSVKHSVIRHRRLCWKILGSPKESSLVPILLSFDTTTTTTTTTITTATTSYTISNALEETAGVLREAMGEI